MAVIEATPEQREQWQAQFSDGYKAGRRDARRNSLREGALIEIPEWLVSETGAEYAARHLADAWRIGYTHAYLFERPKYLGN